LLQCNLQKRHFHGHSILNQSDFGGTDLSQTVGLQQVPDCATTQERLELLFDGHSWHPLGMSGLSEHTLMFV
jgi:hypothetical protein